MRDPAASPTSIAVEPRMSLKNPLVVVGSQPTMNDDNMRIVLVADVGVIETDKPVISVKVEDVVVNALVLFAVTTCTIFEESAVQTDPV